MNPLPASRDATIENRAFAAIAAGGATSIARAPAGADAAGVAAGARVPVILTNGAGFAPTRIARETAALAAALGGLDGFVFTGGIGEHAPEIRAAACERLRASALGGRRAWHRRRRVTRQRAGKPGRGSRHPHR